MIVRIGIIILRTQATNTKYTNANAAYDLLTNNMESATLIIANDVIVTLLTLYRKKRPEFCVIITARILYRERFLFADLQSSVSCY